MRPESIALCQGLLDRHHHVCVPNADGQFPHRSRCTITYGELCELTGTSHILRRVGDFLLEVAQWCDQHGYPYLNALAVNAESGIPGYNYDGAAGCALDHWEEQVDECIRFQGYPETVQQAV